MQHNSYMTCKPVAESTAVACVMSSRLHTMNMDGVHNFTQSIWTWT